MKVENLKFNLFLLHLPTSIHFLQNLKMIYKSLGIINKGDLKLLSLLIKFASFFICYRDYAATFAIEARILFRILFETVQQLRQLLAPTYQV